MDGGARPQSNGSAGAGALAPIELFDLAVVAAVLRGLRPGLNLAVHVRVGGGSGRARLLLQAGAELPALHRALQVAGHLLAPGEPLRAVEAHHELRPPLRADGDAEGRAQAEGARALAAQELVGQHAAHVLLPLAAVLPHHSPNQAHIVLELKLLAEGRPPAQVRGLLHAAPVAQHHLAARPLAPQLAGGRAWTRRGPHAGYPHIHAVELGKRVEESAHEAFERH
mmetsp:Transcript_50031/g.86047  ORF Transcript_50031/g.86047 Transcript_50031/m.86047 type:complete len:225 (-) Transcript_50031:1573-2247(-)